ncbi:hypothetical protein B0H11DRAFT_2041409 [Mycena galericulata]|nr:hypothetical protein B0H11DRAFT_2041409 [Mycena galericulata]
MITMTIPRETVRCSAVPRVGPDARRRTLPRCDGQTRCTMYNAQTRDTAIANPELTLADGRGSERAGFGGRHVARRDLGCGVAGARRDRGWERQSTGRVKSIVKGVDPVARSSGLWAATFGIVSRDVALRLAAYHFLVRPAAPASSTALLVHSHRALGSPSGCSRPIKLG